MVFIFKYTILRRFLINQNGQHVSQTFVVSRDARSTIIFCLFMAAALTLLLSFNPATTALRNRNSCYNRMAKGDQCRS